MTKDIVFNFLLTFEPLKKCNYQGMEFILKVLQP